MKTDLPRCHARQLSLRSIAPAGQPPASPLPLPLFDNKRERPSLLLHVCTGHKPCAFPWQGPWVWTKEEDSGFSLGKAAAFFTPRPMPQLPFPCEPAKDEEREQVMDACSVCNLFSIKEACLRSFFVCVCVGFTTCVTFFVWEETRRERMCLPLAPSPNYLPSSPLFTSTHPPTPRLSWGGRDLPSLLLLRPPHLPFVAPPVGWTGGWVGGWVDG